MLRFLTSLIGCVLCSTSQAQFLAKFDSVLLRGDGDEAVAAGEGFVARFHEMLRKVEVMSVILECRSYRLIGASDFRTHTMVTTGPEAGRLWGLWGERRDTYETLLTLIDSNPEFGRGSTAVGALRLSDGTRAVFYTAGLSPNDGYTTECLMPLQRKDVFVRVSANSIGFCDGGDTRDFDNRFLAAARRFLEAVRLAERSESSNAESVDRAESGSDSRL